VVLVCISHIPHAHSTCRTSRPQRNLVTGEVVSKSFRTVRLERKLQMLQLSATMCSCIAILWVSLVSFAAIILCVASQRVFVVVYFVIDSVRKILDTPAYKLWNLSLCNFHNSPDISPSFPCTFQIFSFSEFLMVTKPSTEQRNIDKKAPWFVLHIGDHAKNWLTST
jgi:hypothetical protein